MKITNYTTKEAKRIIRKKPMPCSLEKEFKNNGLSNELEKVYIRSAELLEENKKRIQKQKSEKLSKRNMELYVNLENEDNNSNVKNSCYMLPENHATSW